jgi:hypothetical protein
MEYLIKKILREETSDFKPALIKAFYSFMEIETQDYELYTDTPENRFKNDPESIWLINTNTEKWALEIEKSGNLWYNAELYYSFIMWFKNDHFVFEQLITMWVEDVLKREVLRIRPSSLIRDSMMENVIEVGIKIS